MIHSDSVALQVEEISFTQDDGGGVQTVMVDASDITSSDSNETITITDFTPPLVAPIVLTVTLRGPDIGTNAAAISAPIQVTIPASQVQSSGTPAGIDVSDLYGSMLKIDKDGSSYSYTVYDASTLPAGFTRIGTSNSYELLDSGERTSVIKPYIPYANYTGVGPLPMAFGNKSGGVGDITTVTGLQYQFEHATNSSNTYSSYEFGMNGQPGSVNVLSMSSADSYTVYFGGDSINGLWNMVRPT